MHFSNKSFRSLWSSGVTQWPGLNDVWVSDSNWDTQTCCWPCVISSLKANGPQFISTGQTDWDNPWVGHFQLLTYCTARLPSHPRSVWVVQFPMFAIMITTMQCSSTLLYLHFLENSPGSGHVPVLNDGVVEVPVEGLLDVRHILHLRYTSDRDLFPPLFICSFRTHVAPGTKQLLHWAKNPLGQSSLSPSPTL